MKVNQENDLVKLYFSCLRIRMIEEEIAKRYSEQEMRCPTHLSTGQELAGAAIGLAAKTTDHAFSTHRSHAHYLGKGGCFKKMLAEIFGKSTGCCKGMGGSMHLRDREVGFQASTAIVGNSIPLGVGDALAAKMDGSNSVSIVFIGDAIFETGVFYESVNIAATFKVPVLFICENNLYSVYSPLKVRQPAERKNYKIVEKMGIKSEYLDGTNATQVMTGLSEAVKYCRETKEPMFVEMSAYRWREHCGPNYDNHIGYRDEQEYEDWKSRDYLAALETMLKQSSQIDDEKIRAAEEKNLAEIAQAFEFAKRSPYPSLHDPGYLEYSEAKI